MPVSATAPHPNQTTYAATVAPADTQDAVEGTTLFAAQLPTVNRAVGIVAARRRLDRTAREELSSDVYMRLLQRNGAILRAYRGEGSLLAYLIVVVQRVLVDGAVARDGKWRPSAAARRLGQTAIHLERLIFCQGLSVQEAAPIVRERTGATHSEDEFEFLLSLLRPRVRRRVLDVANLDDLRADGPSPEDALIAAAQPHAERLAYAMTRLTADDREMVQQRFEQGLRLREIARRRQIDDRAIYRRFDRILGQLRTALGASGSSARTPLRPRPPARLHR